MLLPAPCHDLSICSARTTVPYSSSGLVTTLVFTKGLLAHLIHDLVAECEKLGRPMTRSKLGHAEAEWVSWYNLL